MIKISKTVKLDERWAESYLQSEEFFNPITSQIGQFVALLLVNYNYFARDYDELSSLENNWTVAWDFGEQ